MRGTMVSETLLQVLRCPLGKSPLRDEGNALVCERCGPRFRISPQGFPNMVMDEAELPAGCRRIGQLPCVQHQPHRSQAAPNG
jgi:uncharacterized protein